MTSRRSRDSSHDLLNNRTSGQRYPSQAVPHIAPRPATRPVDIEWSGITDSAKVVNVMQNFRGQCVKTGATIDWSAESANFAFQSESPNPARNLYSVIGHEQNGVFFHLEADD